jgi:hypothetical protein
MLFRSFVSSVGFFINASSPPIDSGARGVTSDGCHDEVIGQRLKFGAQSNAGISAIVNPGVSPVFRHRTLNWPNNSLADPVSLSITGISLLRRASAWLHDGLAESADGPSHATRGFTAKPQKCRPVGPL